MGEFALRVADLGMSQQKFAAYLGVATMFLTAGLVSSPEPHGLRSSA